MTQLATEPQVIEVEKATPVIEAIHVGKSIDGREILHDVNVRIGEGEFVALLGANGSGKTTLLKLLSTLTAPSAGAIHLFGELATAGSVHLRRRIGLIGHQAMLYRDLSPLENLEFFAKLYGIDKPHDRARRMLDMIGLRSRAHDPVRNFSRGMIQRVSIARALVHDPDLILADEPFAGLDAPSIEAFEQLLTELKDHGKTIVVVNHDIEQSLRIAERAIVLRDRRIALDSPTYRLYEREVRSEVRS